jgi:hypothetical protein
MANSSINLVDLDFNAIKTSLKNHLSSQAKFRDYDFDGSNMSVLLDVLAYNTYLNSFYLNMVASEMFLDTAQLRDSVVSHAKELNYIPRSFRSAYANVNISITPASNTTSVVIPSKTAFTARLGSNTFNFVTSDAVSIANNTNGVFYANNVLIYEGSYTTDTFIKNDAIPNQRFVLNNPNIDTTSLEMTVTENSGANVYVYTQGFSLFGVNGNTQVFFIQSAENEAYEVIFGDNSYGRMPKNGAIIDISYRVCNGELPNGVDNFINNTSIDGHSNVAIVINAEASGGSISESTESIKYNAPRSFQTQERAITEGDFEILLTREFPEIQAISVYGGEKESPPQFGKIFVSVKSSSYAEVPNGKKASYIEYLRDKVPLGFSVEVIDPDYVYLYIASTVKYDPNVTTLNDEQIKSKVLQKIAEFNSTYLNDFNKTFRYSNFVTSIDSADPSIINNDTDVLAFIKLIPTIDTPTNFAINFHAPILPTTPSESGHAIASDHGISSTPFVSEGLTVELEDDGAGNIRIVRSSGTSHVEVRKVGTVNYETGEIIITGLNVSSYTSGAIKLYAKMAAMDFSSTLQNVLILSTEDVLINMVPDIR